MGRGWIDAIGKNDAPRSTHTQQQPRNVLNFCNVLFLVPLLEPQCDRWPPRYEALFRPPINQKLLHHSPPLGDLPRRHRLRRPRKGNSDRYLGQAAPDTSSSQEGQGQGHRKEKTPDKGVDGLGLFSECARDAVIEIGRPTSRLSRASELIARRGPAGCLVSDAWKFRRTWSMLCGRRVIYMLRA